MLRRKYKDWWEWVQLERTVLVGGYLSVVYKLMGKAQTPPQHWPKSQPHLLDDAGWVMLPEGWEPAQVATITLWILPRGQKGAGATRALQLPINPVGPTLGQDVVEGLVCQQLPVRLPPAPFAGELQVEMRVEGKRLWSKAMGVEVGWVWPHTS